MFPGITGFDESQEPAFRQMFFSAPPEVQQWLMGNLGTLRQAKGPFETVMQDMLAKAPPMVQKWAGAHKLGVAPAAPAMRSITPTAGPIAAAAAPHGGLVTISTRGGQTVQVNELYAKNFEGFLNDLESRGYPIHSIGGFSDRSIAGSNKPSYHKLGAAIDINPDANPVTHGQTVTDLPADISDIAAKWGLGWGGNWHSKKDPMHFSAARSEGGTFDVNRYGSVGPIRPQTSNPDAALVSAAGMTPPVQPGPIVAVTGGAAPGGAMPGLGGMFGGLGGGGFAIPPPPPRHDIQPSPPLEAAQAAQAANQKAREMVDFLLPVEDQTATSGEAPPGLFAAATNPAAAEGVFQRIFAKPKLAENPGGVKYRA